MGCDLTNPSARRIRAVWRFFVVLVAIVSMLALTSCGGSGGNDNPDKVTVTITPEATTITPSSTLTLQATVTGATDERVTWTSNGGSVTNTGVFTAPTTTGTYTVTATSVADTSASATATITVANATGVVVTVSPMTISVAPNAEVQLTATVTGTTNKKVNWTASAGSVTSEGVFTAPSTTGAVTVRATSVADPSASAFSRVTVTNTAPTVQITPLGATLGTNETQQFTATVSNTSNQNVTWTATGGTISSTGLFRAGSTAGTFKVTATSQADTSVSTSVTVSVTKIKITVTPNGGTATAGEQVQFFATVSGTSNHNVVWTTSAGSISSSGLLTTPNTAQTVTVTATSVADPSVSGTGTITLTDQSDFLYDFQSGAPSEWSPTTVSTVPAGTRKFLGRFSGTDVATLSLEGLTPHNSLTLTFDLFVIGAWDGTDAGALFSVTSTGSTDKFAKTFSNLEGDQQTYPDGVLVNPGTGAAEKNTLGYTHSPDILYKDAVYHITLDLTNHTATTATIKFFANLSGAITDKSWGIDNVHVHANP